MLCQLSYGEVTDDLVGFLLTSLAVRLIYPHDADDSSRPPPYRLYTASRACRPGRRASAVPAMLPRAWRPAAASRAQVSRNPAEEELLAACQEPGLARGLRFHGRRMAQPRANVSGVHRARHARNAVAARPVRNVPGNLPTDSAFLHSRCVRGEFFLHFTRRKHA